MKIQSTLADMLELLDEKEKGIVFPHMPIEHFYPEGLAELIDIKHLLDQSGPAAFLAAFKCGHEDISSIGRAIAADIAEICLPVIKDEEAAGYAIRAIQAARWYADGLVDEACMYESCRDARDCAERFLHKNTSAATWNALESAVLACYGEEPDVFDGEDSPISSYDMMLEALACHKEIYMKEARVFDLCTASARNSDGIANTADTHLEKTMHETIDKDVRPAVDPRVSQIIRAHLGW